MAAKTENILLIAGSGRNVGKTTLACKILQQENEKKPVAVKITPHFHEATPGLVEFARGDGWMIYEETNASTRKDSSKFLQNGAAGSYLIEAQKERLDEAFSALLKEIPDNVPVVIESTALAEFVVPGLFVAVLHHEDFRKTELEPLLNQAGLLVVSDGEKFFPSPQKIVFENHWMIH
jgi:hypothetical protein